MQHCQASIISQYHNLATARRLVCERIDGREGYILRSKKYIYFGKYLYTLHKTYNR